MNEPKYSLARAEFLRARLALGACFDDQSASANYLAAALRVVEAAREIKTGRPEQTLAEDADALAAALAEWGE